jgi:putative membrane-bound dehydrogenase-like protein
MMPLLRCAAVVAVFIPSLLHAATTSAPTVTAADLPRVPPTEPVDTSKTFKVRPGFHLEIAAAEPNVIDPIAMCFDENGRMFVVEMRDYSERRAEKLGRIRMLEDLNADGIYEKSTIFLEGLPWPTAVMWVNGGVLVGACPDIIFAKDTNGDGVADEQRILFTGFGTEDRLNVQGLFNNFNWGLDNRIHGCSGHVGGSVKQALHPDKPPLDVKNKGFVIDPRDWSMTTEAGGGQYGLSFDHAGRLFTCSNSSHCEVFMYDERYAARNPFAQIPDPRISIAADGPAAEVFRASPEEPWRVIRTRWRIAGLVGGPVEGGGRSAGYFTGATGITIYRGDAFGPQYVGDAFIGDAGGNLIHHKRIRQGKDGITPIAERPEDEKKTEFVASTDNWFRPVDFANTPDGTLFIADMYRETIEHPWSLPPEIKKYLDLNSGNDRGRIYRLAPDGFISRPPPKLGDAPVEQLVSLLAHPNGWHRETASRLLFERQDKSALALLAELVAQDNLPFARMHALCVLDGLGALTEATMLAALNDSVDGVRVHAIRLAERFPESDEIWTKLASMTKDPDPRPRYQLAFTAGAFKRADQPKVLAALAKRDGASEWMRAAILSSCADSAGELFELLAADSSPLLLQVTEIIGAQSKQADIDRVVKFIATSKQRKQRLAIASALTQRSSQGLSSSLAAVIDEAKQTTSDPKAPAADRVAAIQLLGLVKQADGLAEMLNQPSQMIQSAALSAMDRADSSKLPDAVLAAWAKFTPRMQSDAVAAMIKRPSRAQALLNAIIDGRIKPNALSAPQANLLRKSADATVKELAIKALPPPPSREEVIEKFRPALALTGDAARGHEIYAKRCISCHRANGEGSQIGPDWATFKNAGREKLLFNILDPNREVSPQYVSFLIETKDGQAILGIPSSDLPSGITIRQAYGRETTIPRDNIKRMSSDGKSLMPEALEEGLTPQDFADLLSFVESAK